ncbi:MAG: type II toxin-antitoxin system PemK/MazF family toxin [Firmicutes bacterium]|nr:type II toxin-antitoxin system PemK/MazF family toxin [Bacillota bacterium]
MKKISKGSIYYTNIEQNEKNSTPVLVIQNNIGNEINSSTIITPIITKDYAGKKKTTHIELDSLKNVRPNSIVCLEQIRTINKSKLHGFVCMLKEREIRKIDKAIKISLGLK